MHKGKYVFSQLLDFLDRNDFNYLAMKYGGDKYVKQFTVQNLKLSLRLIMRNDNVRSSQVCSSRNVAMGGHQSAVWRPNGACGARTEDGRHRSARKTSLCAVYCAVYCAESCGRLV
ncbi:MAG TPA: DUF4372 domain-containing protein [Candidatus Cryptobacteroides merdipullorum]|uniref:DUF4372 domain-containing protein n=1 Tax=Candidatus Cryptobacteroides merdipullorum TaxID=2840771 RepID=A0A9D1GNX0_9BACT|nr:DUF4372 domain-containing protein [Candidatus Cryptobacteroides merdipullorum]